MNQNDVFSWLNAAADQMPTPEAQAQMSQEAIQEQLDTADMIRRALTTDAGKILLDMLVQNTIMTPMMQVSAGIPVNGEVALSPSDWAYVRAGQNSVVHFLLNQIELSKNPPKLETNEE